jgi:uncharacterized protein (TIGR02444 family)
MTERDPGAEFWDFTLSFYGRDGVSPACIALQDDHAKDVNLALFCCWLGISGRGRITAARLAAADAVITPWRQQVIEPLRAARRALKAIAGPGSEGIYAAVKKVELEGERLGQQRLAALAPPRSDVSAADAREDAAANLALYCDDAAARAAARPLVVALAG